MAGNSLNLTAPSAADASKSAYDAALSASGIKRTGAQTNTAAKGSKTTLGQEDFIALMTAQLKNQDPFKPVDNTEMVAQMAQFSSVAGISDMNKSLAAISARLGATSTADAMSFVGRNVLTEGKTAYERSTGGLAGAVELGGAASDVNVAIADKDGKVVKNLQLGEQPQGTATFDWNGKDDAGNTVENGPYTITVEAANKSAIVAATPLVWAPVQSATLVPGGEPVLNVAGLGEVKPASVRKVA
ncbi:flagellar hook assembly protein FlgD [uncultured Sphingomonas sp.]|uniref:flagellar hook assembly protein FlgD n=1 Tax=uncultured Sphingomonas sp. TaxID=158754 RepID=UPI002590608D|nr:flagellar hook assembly protein FlgD [uncultured Sphingomonas sp.]